MSARDNAQVYDERARIMKKKNKIFFQTILIGLMIFYVFMFTSRYWMVGSYKDIDVTKMGTTITANNRDVTLMSWKYAKKQKIMEVIIGIDNTSYDGVDQYQWTAIDKISGSLHVKPVIQDRDFVVLQITDLPSRVSVISLRMDSDLEKSDSAEEEWSTIRLYGDPTRNIEQVDQIQAKTETDYKIDRLDTEIAKYNQTIDDITDENAELTEKIDSIQKTIDDAKADQKYQTQSEIEKSDQKIISLMSQQNGFKDQIDNNNEKVTEASDKIKNLQKEISDIKEGD